MMFNHVEYFTLNMTARLAQLGKCPSVGTVLVLGSPAGLTGRGVGSHAFLVALQEEHEPSHKWGDPKPVQRMKNN